MKGVTFQFKDGGAIESVEQFLTEIRGFAGEESFDCHFRGEPEFGDTLLPSIGRAHYHAGKSITFTGSVWAIRRRGNARDLDVFHERLSPLAVRGIKLVYPFYPTPRLTAPSGMFTLHGDPWTDLMRGARPRYGRDDLDIMKLQRWTVSSHCKPAMILDLERFAVNSRTLFPDFDGLARGLWQTQVIRHGKKK